MAGNENIILTPYWHDEFQERSAIMEADAGMNQADADAAAIRDVKQRIAKTWTLNTERKSQ